MLIRTRLLFWLLAWLVLGLTGEILAQVKQIIHGPDRPWEYEFTVDPAPEPQPSLRFRILPDSLSRKPGNAATSFYRALHLFNVHPEKDRKEFEECINFALMIRPTATGPNAKPIESVSVERVQAVVDTFADVLQELQISAFCENCDWGEQNNDAFESMNRDFSEFASARQLARLLHQKARLEIVDRDYNGAFETIQVAFQLARNVAKCPKILPGLVGTAISKETQVLLMEIIASPQSPNLYWALASVPSPFVDMHQGLEEELNLIMKFPLIRDAERPRTDEEWQRLFLETIRTVTKYAGNAQSDAAASDEKLMEEMKERIDREFPRAKADLVRFGVPPDRIAALSVFQVIAMHEAKLVRYKCDDALKLIALSYHEAAPLAFQWESTLRGWDKPVRLTDSKEVLPLLRSLAPPMTQLLRATNSLDRVLVRNRVIEAIRMHAAANHGNPPTSLAEITIVPIPLDPTTGKPIIFKLDGNMAVLEFPADMPSFSEIVRVTIRKGAPESTNATVDEGAQKLSAVHKPKEIERSTKVVIVDNGTGVWEKLKGKWATVTMQESGTQRPDAELKAAKHTLTFDEKRLTQTLVPKNNDPEIVESSFKIDASKTPWEMDWFDLSQKSLNRPNAEKLPIEMMGIFELSGDTLKIHFIAHRDGKNMKGDPVKRPADFNKTVDGNYGDVLMTLQRIRP